MANILFACMFFSCKGEEETVLPKKQNITESVYATGKVKSKGQYEVFASAPGIIQQIHVKEGDEVLKGAVLISLVNETAQLSAENARLAASYSSITANMDKLRESEANISLARTKLQNDSLLLVRQRALWANAIGSRNELDQRELAFKNSATAYQTAVLHDKELRKQLRFAAEQSNKNLAISSTLANDYIIRAKQPGKVYWLAKETGELVSVQSPVAIIGDANAFVLELQVDEYDVSKIKIGQQVMVVLDSYKGKVFEALLTKIRPLMNERSRSLTVEATFVNQPDGLVPNLTAEANILIQARQNALTIPRSYLLDSNTVILPGGIRRKVVVGLKDYECAEILSGLSENESIVKPTE